MGHITLEGIEFFAYHGFYDEEQKIGNKYALDISIQTDIEAAARHDKLSETINYEVLYAIANEVMREKFRLLEHIAFRIIEKIRNYYPDIQKVTVKVSKFNPPIGGVCEKASIVLEG